MTNFDDLLDDLFLGCALSAFVELAHANRAFPDQEQTRILAYRYYEEALAALNPALPNHTGPPSSNCS